MIKKNKMKKPTVSELARKNPKVDERVVADSLALINHLRSIGVKPKGFDILRVWESKLKVGNPIYLGNSM